MLDVVGYAVAPRYFFVQNQAETLLYMGHGYHEDAHVRTIERDIFPENIGKSWTKGLQTVILFACSVLDIRDMNCWWPECTNPGLLWLDSVPGPSTWLGFQKSAPRLFHQDDHGEDIVCTLADQRRQGRSWVDAWHLATHKNQWMGSSTQGEPPRSGCLTKPRHNAVAGVAIGGRDDTDIDRMYYYWDEQCWWPGICFYSWAELPEAHWREPCTICLYQEPAGLEVWVIPPIEVHVYNPAGQHVGPGVEGIETGIPGASYGIGAAVLESGEEVTPLHVSIQGADLNDIYRLHFVSVVDGPFDLFIEIPDRSAGVFYRASYLAVPGRAGTGYFLLLEPDNDFSLLVDDDGDGLFDRRWAPSTLTTHPTPGAP